jgi:hypothetical protein
MPLIRITLVATGLLALAACVAPITEENAPERMAETVCKKQRRCEPDLYEDLYQSEFDECVDENEAVYDLVLGIGDLFGLGLDIEEVRKCARDIRTASCDEWRDGDIGNDCDDILSF